MNRRELLKRSAALGLAAGIPSLAAGKLCAGTDAVQPKDGTVKTRQVATRNPLVPPAQGTIPIAFVISKGAVVIDFCGPWEVFENIVIPGRKDPATSLYTVAETNEPIRVSGGMKIIPDYTFEAAPAPKVVVIPAQDGQSERMLEWIRKSTKATDVTMSVCTGAFVLASTGLLAGKAATTHHTSYSDLEMKFPDIQVKRGARFVEAGNLASAGGLSSGIDLALRVVERYYGHTIALGTADQLEYQGKGWMNPESNQVYATVRASTPGHPRCPVCGMDGDPAFKSVYEGKTYLACDRQHQQAFDADPAKFANVAHSQ